MGYSVRLVAVCLVVLGLASPSLFAEDALLPLAIGAGVPAFSLPGVDGQVHALGEFKASKVLVVVFLCNHCVESQVYEGRVEKMAEDYRGKGVAVVGISADAPDSLSLKDLAYSDVGDSLAEMKVRAGFRHFSFPYLYDGTTQKVARAFGAEVSPQVFVFDGERKLRYSGRVDDSVNEALVKSSDARNAIDAILGGKPVGLAETKAVGCATQWARSPEEVKAVTAKMEVEPVTVALAGTADLTKLRENPTGKLLLVNFFATWCGPCVSEFPDLMATNRMYRGRGFAMTTVSSNEPEEKADVLKFLVKMHASTNNLLFATTDTYALQAAFDPAMGAGVPFTVLIAPNGDILFQQQGDLDMMEMRRAILANLPDDAAHAGAQKYWAGK